MNVEIQTMDPNVARTHYIEYRRSVRKLREKRRSEAAVEADRVHTKRTQIEREENDMRAAYRAMSLGQRVVVLPPGSSLARTAASFASSSLRNATVLSGPGSRVSTNASASSPNKLLTACK